MVTFSYADGKISFGVMSVNVKVTLGNVILDNRLSTGKHFPNVIFLGLTGLSHTKLPATVPIE